MSVTSPDKPGRAVTGEAQVVELLRQCVHVTKIADVTTWPVAAVRRLAAREGMLIDDQGVPRPAGASPAQAGIVQADLRELLRLAAACPDDAQVKQARARLDNAVQMLRGRLIEAQGRKERREAAVQQAAEAEREVARLTAQLDQAKAQVDQVRTQLERARDRLAQARSLLGEPRRATRPAAPEKAARRFWPGADYNTRQVRAWAKANGHGDALPKGGAYVPDEVIDAMRAASPAPAEPESAGTAQSSAATPDDA